MLYEEQELDIELARLACEVWGEGSEDLAALQEFLADLLAVESIEQFKNLSSESKSVWLKKTETERSLCRQKMIDALYEDIKAYKDNVLKAKAAAYEGIDLNQKSLSTAEQEFDILTGEQLKTVFAAQNFLMRFEGDRLERLIQMNRYEIQSFNETVIDATKAQRDLKLFEMRLYDIAERSGIRIKGHEGRIFLVSYSTNPSPR